MTYVSLLTLFHTAISLVAIVVGAPAILSLFDTHRFRSWRKPFLVTAAITFGTGFIFPFNGPTPAFVTGIVAAIILAAVAIAERRSPAGRPARWTFAGGMVASLYLLVFVLIAQAFQKVPFLNQFAPTGTEPAFAIVQVLALLGFVGIGLAALRALGSAALSARA